MCIFVSGRGNRSRKNRNGNFLAKKKFFLFTVLITRPSFGKQTKYTRAYIYNT